MNIRGLKIIVSLAVLLLFAAWAAAAEVTLDTCASYLTAMKIQFKKEGADRLTFKTGFPDAKQYDLICVADAKNKFVYLAVLNLMKLGKDAPNLCDVTKKMASLNYGMVMTKLEWDEKSGEVRLSATMTTEEGLSQKQFSTMLTTLLLAAEQADKQLK